ncbi:dTDP-4-dehydrorhamnose 3,5-epimerase [Anaerolineales bacterium]
MTQLIESTIISDVMIAELKVFADERGEFMETFRKDWFPQVSWEKIQGNRSNSKANVLRGLHYHFHQVDYWYVPKGRIRAALLDLRSSSPTYGHSQMIEMGEDHNIGLFIPVGVAHGFVALSDCTLMYTVNNYYDGKDEFGVAWNDPTIGMDWGITKPMLSGRDAANPMIVDIPASNLPK